MDYSSIAGNYNRVESEAKTLWLLGYPALSRLLSPIGDKEILDYGCGTGIFCRLLQSQGAKVSGVDISEGMISVAKEASDGKISYSCIDSGDLGQFDERSFDHVTSNFVLCTIPGKGMIIKILREIFRVLRGNGTFILMNTNWEEANGKEFVSYKLEYCDNLVSGQSVRAITKSDPPIIFEDYFHSKAEYCDFLEEAGFIIDSIEEPVALEDDSSWLDERNFPPFFMIKARKPF